MIALRAFLWLLLVPLALTMLGGVNVLVRPRPKNVPFLTVLLGIPALMAPGLTLGYALIWNWGAIWWFALALVYVLLAGATIAFLDSKAAREREFGDGGVATVPSEKKAARSQGSTDWKALTGAIAPILVLELVVTLTIMTANEIVAANAVPMVARWSVYPCALGLYAIGSATERIATNRATSGAPFSVADDALGVGCALHTVAAVALGILFLWSLDGIWRHAPSPFWSPGGLALPTLGAASGLMFGARALLASAITQLDLQTVTKDQRPPVVYLRSFEREQPTHSSAQRRRMRLRNTSLIADNFGTLARMFRHVNDEAAVEAATGEMIRRYQSAHQSRSVYGRLSLRGWAGQIASGRGIALDEQSLLASYFNELGPYVAIARPNESVFQTDVGALKRRMPDDAWRTEVLDLVHRSCVIVLEVGTSPGLLWEIQQVVAKAPPRKVLVILPDTESRYRAFLESGGECFPIAFPPQLPASRLVMFDDQWQPIALRDTSTLHDAIDNRSSVSLLMPFLRRNGYTVENDRIVTLTEAS